MVRSPHMRVAGFAFITGALARTVGNMTRSSHPTGEHSSARGWTLVAIQFALMAGVVAAWFLPSPGPALPHHLGVGIVALAIAVLLGALAVRDLGQSLTPHPDPNHQGLRTHGIYSRIRHPMYTAVMLAASSAALANGKLTSWSVVVALVILFEIKTRHEERHLVQAYPAYVDYATHTGKYVPMRGVSDHGKRE